MNTTPDNTTAVHGARTTTHTHAGPRRALTAAAFLVALALTSTGPPAVAMYSADGGGHTPSTTGSTTWDPESLLAARHRQMDAAWRVGPVAQQVTAQITAQVTRVRRTTLSYLF